MQRLAAPMIGGMITALLLSLFVIPAIYKLLGPTGSLALFVRNKTPWLSARWRSRLERRVAMVPY